MSMSMLEKARKARRQRRLNALYKEIAKLEAESRGQLVPAFVLEGAKVIAPLSVVGE